MLLPGPLKNIMRGSRGVHTNGTTQPVTERSHAFSRTGKETVITRPSRGLEEFFNNVRDQVGLTILDLGAASQQNVSFITNLGHRLYSEDMLRVLNESFGPEDIATQSNPGQIDFFLRQALDYPEHHFDGVLIWDALEYLAPALLASVVERLYKIVRPNSHMLAFFHSDDKLDAVPFLSFRIQDVNMLQVGQCGTRKPVQLFNNRNLERMFVKAQSAKFFLTRDRLREVVVKV
jgi:2-polyprenyl-3-methyl-5-hydroxy-6-metoxy-1,4-benzoquinol methylase